MPDPERRPGRSPAASAPTLAAVAVVLAALAVAVVPLGRQMQIALMYGIGSAQLGAVGAMALGTVLLVIGAVAVRGRTLIGVGGSVAAVHFLLLAVTTVARLGLGGSPGGTVADVGGLLALAIAATAAGLALVGARAVAPAAAIGIHRVALVLAVGAAAVLALSELPGLVAALGYGTASALSTVVVWARVLAMVLAVLLVARAARGGRGARIVAAVAALLAAVLAVEAALGVREWTGLAFAAAVVAALCWATVAAIAVRLALVAGPAAATGDRTRS
ncbi:hypothetical protein M3147_18090 [Agromyces mediolanus]|uniref:hypothetical protein n=1 Tax=Agromyces mediolanus TaxID=41986 RepID=UPI00203AAD27|nr:hypothetical protein [Agromyces mediolanus]MCM3659168.1 hypothetical protein [Agromyces mediolanus]